MCVSAKCLFKTRPPISMWSGLPWPVEFPPCPLAIVIPCFASLAPGPATSTRKAAASRPPASVSGSSFSTLGTLHLPHALCISLSPLLVKTFALLCPGSPAGQADSISCCRWSSLQGERWAVSADLPGWTREVVVVAAAGERGEMESLN